MFMYKSRRGIYPSFFVIFSKNNGTAFAVPTQPSPCVGISLANECVLVRLSIPARLTIQRYLGEQVQKGGKGGIPPVPN